MNLFYDRENKPMATLEWARKFEDAEYRIIALDYDGEHVMVSTIWEGISPPSTLPQTAENSQPFETAVLVDGRVTEKHRWHDEQGALDGHHAICWEALGRGSQPEDGFRQQVIVIEQAGDAEERADRGEI